MPYFFIIPAFAVLLFVLIAAAFGAHYVPQFERASGYLFGGVIGTLIEVKCRNLPA